MNLDRFNHILYKASKDRWELRISKNNIVYLYDYNDNESRLVRNKKEIKDIIDCQCLNNFVYNNKENKELTKFRKEFNV